MDEEVESFIPYDLTGFKAAIMYTSMMRCIEADVKTLKKYQGILLGRTAGKMDDLELTDDQIMDQIETLLVTIDSMKEMMKDYGEIIQELSADKKEEPKIILPPRWNREKN